MNNSSKTHPFLPSWLTGKHRRIQTKPADGSLSADVSSSAHSYQQASNTDLRVFELIRPILEGESCLIVTGYQDFLSALSIILQFRPEIASEKPNTLRIIFGTNIDNSLAMRSSSRTLPDGRYENVLKPSCAGIVGLDVLTRWADMVLESSPALILLGIKSKY